MRVNCDRTDNILLRSKSGTSEFWYGLHVEQVAGYGAVVSVVLTGDGGKTFTTCSKTVGNPSFMSCASTDSTALTPLTAVLTDDDGNTITLTDCITSFDGNTEFQCNAQFSETVVK